MLAYRADMYAAVHPIAETF